MSLSSPELLLVLDRLDRLSDRLRDINSSLIALRIALRRFEQPRAQDRESGAESEKEPEIG